MSPFVIANWILFLIVLAYGIYLIAHVIKTRITFIMLGKKAVWDKTLKERINALIIYVFGQKKLLKDKKSGAIHVMMFYGFLLVQFGAIDLIWKGLVPGSHLPFGPLYPAFKVFQEFVVFYDFGGCGLVFLPPLC